MSGVFVSCSGEDAGLARRIVSGLRKLGVVAWSDEDFPGIDREEDQVDQAIALIALWTPNSLGSRNPRDQAQVGLHAKKLVNVLFGVASPPFPFDVLNGIPLDDWDGINDSSGWERLVGVIQALLGEGGQVSPGDLARAAAASRPSATNTSGFASQSHGVDLLTLPLSEVELGIRSHRPAAEPTTRWVAEAVTAEAGVQWRQADPREAETAWSSVSASAPPSPAPPPPARLAVKPSSGAGRWALIAAGGLATLVIGAALSGKEIASAITAAAKLLHLSIVPSPGAPPSPDDSVDVSVFAPPLARPGDELLVQVFLHTLDDSGVAGSAIAADPVAVRKGGATLDVALARGERVDICIDAMGVEVAEPTQSFVWRGRAQSVQFLAIIPKDRAPGPVQFRVRVLRASIPIGQVRFALPVQADGDRRGLGLVGDKTVRFSRAFLSYAHEDRVEVLKRAQALRAARIEVFQDILSIRTGERWEPRLEAEIDACDLFLLFWSEAARQSQWVAREVDRALDLQSRSAAHAPEIMPVILEGPPPPKPPDRFRHLHFEDMICYVIAAQNGARG